MYYVWEANDSGPIDVANLHSYTSSGLTARLSPNYLSDELPGSRKDSREINLTWGKGKCPPSLAVASCTKAVDVLTMVSD